MLTGIGGRSRAHERRPIESPDADEDHLKPVDFDPTTAAKRQHFHQTQADELARAVGMDVKRTNKATEKFAYYQDAERFVVIAGAQEKHEVAQAFARGLGLRGDRRLVLVLPDGRSFATMQRAPWFKTDARPEIWTYGKTAPTRQKLKTPKQTCEALLERLKPNQTLDDELVASTTAKHLGTHSTSVWELVEWATSHARLDPSHLRGERAWHCLGQKVLSIKGMRGGLAIRAGVHYTGANAPKPVVSGDAEVMSELLHRLQTALPRARRHSPRARGRRPVRRARSDLAAPTLGPHRPPSARAPGSPLATSVCVPSTHVKRTDTARIPKGSRSGYRVAVGFRQVQLSHRGDPHANTCEDIPHRVDPDRALVIVCMRERGRCLVRRDGTCHGRQLRRVLVGSSISGHDRFPGDIGAVRHGTGDTGDGPRRT